jgi:hypothetical protein
MSGLDTMLIKARRGNLRRYQRLLRTHLTELERSFILRRLDEERSVLRNSPAGRRRPARAAISGLGGDGRRCRGERIAEPGRASSSEGATAIGPPAFEKSA